MPKLRSSSFLRLSYGSIVRLEKLELVRAQRSVSLSGSKFFRLVPHQGTTSKVLGFDLFEWHELSLCFPSRIVTVGNFFVSGTTKDRTGGGRVGGGGRSRMSGTGLTVV